jgi:methionine-rich copper-binding protein CopC
VDIRQFLGGVALGFVAAMGAALPASAHSAVTSTFPAADAPATLVDSVSLTANEDLLDLGDSGNGFVFSVTDSAGHFYGDGCVAVDGPTAAMAVVLGEAGSYTVAYRIVSADGHPLEGSWVFSYTPEAGSPVGEAFLELPVCGVDPAPVKTAEPTLEPEPIVIAPAPQVETFSIAPVIGVIAVAVTIGAVWLLSRLLGKPDSEDHLN